MNNETKITINNLIYALLFLVFGIILLTSTDDLVGIASKVVGTILLVFGAVKIIVYIYMKGKMGNYRISELLVGLLIIGLGILLILYSSTLSFVIRIVVGLWILFAGVNRIILSIYVRKYDKIGFRMYLITSILMILLGMLLISGLIDKMLGLFIIMYSLIEIVDYIYYIINGKKYEFNDESNAKIVKVKNSKVVDAIIDEE